MQIKEELPAACLELLKEYEIAQYNRVVDRRHQDSACYSLTAIPAGGA